MRHKIGKMFKIWLEPCLGTIYYQICVFVYSVKRHCHLPAHVLDEIRFYAVGKLRLIAGFHKVGLRLTQIGTFGNQCGIGMDKVFGQPSRMPEQNEHNRQKNQQHHCRSQRYQHYITLHNT